MIKRLLLFVITAALCIPAFEQSAKIMNYQVVDLRRLHFGFTIGFNAFDFNFKRNKPGDPAFAQVIGLEPGFNVNIVSELRLNEDFALRLLPGLVFGQRRVSFLDSANANPHRTVTPKIKVPDYGSVDVESNYLDFPIILKYKAKRYYNFRPYLIGGISFMYDMAAAKNPKLDGSIDGVDPSVKLKPFDTYLELGYGMDFYLTYFKFSTEIKLCLGTRNILNSPLQVAGISGFTSKLILLNFHFE
jgi:hypothetical protein